MLSSLSAFAAFPAFPPLTTSSLSFLPFILYLIRQVGTLGGTGRCSTCLELLVLCLWTTQRAIVCAERLRVAAECTKEIGFHGNKAEVLDSASSFVASRHRQHQYMTRPRMGRGVWALGLALQRQYMTALSALFCEPPLTCALRTGKS